MHTSFLSYSTYIPTQQEHAEVQKVTDERSKQRKVLIDQHVADNGYVKIKHDYYGVFDAYYDPQNKIVYTVSPICSKYESIQPTFKQLYDDRHILELNSLV